LSSGTRESAFSVHLNENFGDWDMIPAFVNVLQCLEALMWMLKVGYEGWLLMDMFPFRLAPVKAASKSVKNVKRLIESKRQSWTEFRRRCMNTTT